MFLEFDHQTLGQRVLFGDGKAVDHVVSLIDDFQAQRVMLIGGQESTPITAEIADKIKPAVWFTRVIQHVPVDLAAEATRAATEAGADLVITVGGGSATGLGKAIARETGIPIIAVPTTFAGSEATDVWGLTEIERKITGSDPRVLPKVVVYDPALTASLPHDLAISSGLNALAHAIDSLWAPRADPINLALGAEGARALISGMRRMHADPNHPGGREQTLYGGYLAAVAFASAGSGMHHKICHTLGGAFGLPHAPTHAVVLGYVTAYNVPYAPAAEARISAAFDGADGVTGLDRLRSELNAPRSLAELGLAESDIDKAAALALPAIPISNPAPVDLPRLTALIRAAWAGDPLTSVDHEGAR
jgi:maleylacetate reductase